MPQLTTSYSAIILGAGAAGLACAGATQNMENILILDHGQKMACKVDIAGGGKANFTNKNMGIEHFHTANPQFCRSALSRFTPDDCLEWLNTHKMQYEEREHGQFFCTRSAKDFSRLLREGCSKSTVKLETTIRHVSYTDETFFIETSSGHYSAPNLVIALGSAAFPQTGATSLGLHLAQQLGHKTIPFRPALAGFILPNWNNETMAGMSLPVRLHVQKIKDAYPIQNFPATLSLLFTHKGISGPAALQASLLWEKNTPITIDFLPDNNLENELLLPAYGKLLLKNTLKQFFPERFCQWILTEFNIPNTRTAELSKKHRQTLVQTIHAYTVTPTAIEDLPRAEVAKGGVVTDDVSSKTFESKLCKGLYFCGEVLDVTGRLGGYNLHWALASGKAVGMALSQKMQKDANK